MFSRETALILCASGSSAVFTTVFRPTLSRSDCLEPFLRRVQLGNMEGPSKNLGITKKAEKKAKQGTRPALQCQRCHCLIQDLPTEILQEIFDHACLLPKDDYHRTLSVELANAISISLTCKRFYSITLPYVYRSPDCGSVRWDINAYPHFPNTTNVRILKLHRTFEKKPEVLQMCRSLPLSSDRVMNFRTGLSEIILSFPSLTNLKTLTLGVVCDSMQSWQVISKALKQLVALESLYFSPLVIDKFGPTLNKVQSGLALPHLRTLGFHNSTLAGNSQLDGRRVGRGRALLHRGTSSVTSLLITAPRRSFPVIEDLIAWPHALEHFIFDDSPSIQANSCQYWDISNICSHLQRHSKTLSSVNISCSQSENPPNNTYFDTSNFIQLRNFQLSRSNICNSSPDAVAKLLGQNIHTLSINCQCYEGRTTMNIPSFDIRLARSLVEIAQVVAAQQWALKEIRILFSKNPPDWSGNAARSLHWGQINKFLNLMVAVRLLLEEKGIVIFYGCPTRREFDDFFQKRAAESLQKKNRRKRKEKRVEDESETVPAYVAYLRRKCRLTGK